ncbi:DUF4232 domain-containing protein [Streptomyces sp. NBC_01618]|uniref:DUF4232 domain-containing protein n=1 Tax=Streptomyces sp. NBC_01618 TaxID=2975900 RepID=UPI0038708DA1|nr:DUF4232 domain-containing protein [Streptomyces sp. NBC_01618]
MAVVSLTMGAAGCNDGASPSAEPAGSSRSARDSTAPDAPVAPGEPAPAGSATPSASAATSAPAAGSGPGRCTTEALTMSLRQGDAGAGQIHYRLTLVNKSSHSCTLAGFPGVSLIRRDGSMIGEPAEREGAAGRVTVIGAKDSAEVTLHTLNRGIKGSECWERPDYLRVYPPGSRQALTLRTSQPLICGDLFRTTAVSG